MVDTSLKITYGLPDLPERNIDITELIYTKHTTHSIAYIPSGDIKRAQIFSDPFPNILKSIFITVNGITTMYTDKTELYIDFKNGLVFTENILDSLEELHKTLSLDFGSFQDELPEQKMVVRYLTGKEKVLEIGGNIGRNSLIISSILRREKNHQFVVLETDKNSYLQLIHNKDLNDLVFYVENSALSKRKLIQKGWETIQSDELLPGYTNVKCIDWDALCKKYAIEFDTLVLDCEGAFYYILKDMPEMLTNIQLIIMENDYKDISHKRYVDMILRKYRFAVDYQESGGWGPCYNFFFEVWKRKKDTTSPNSTPANNILFTQDPKWYDTFIYFLESELSPRTVFPIYLNYGEDNGNYIYYNTEQLTVPHYLEKAKTTINTTKPKEVWDFSEANCEIFRKNGIQATHVPLKSPEWYIHMLKSFQCKEYDVGFAGTINERRLYILDALEKEGVVVQKITDFGEARDKKLACCRIILNIHYSEEYQIFESNRCEPWLQCGIPVISEKSLDDDPRCIVSDYTSLIETTLRYLREC
jgi:FkbM family methyltransferase